MKSPAKIDSTVEKWRVQFAPTDWQRIDFYEIQPNTLNGCLSHLISTSKQIGNIFVFNKVKLDDLVTLRRGSTSSFTHNTSLCVRARVRMIMSATNRTETQSILAIYSKSNWMHSTHILRNLINTRRSQRMKFRFFPQKIQCFGFIFIITCTLVWLHAFFACLEITLFTFRLLFGFVAVRGRKCRNVCMCACVACVCAVLWKRG